MNHCLRNNTPTIESKRKFYYQNKIYSLNILCRVLSIKVPITYNAHYFRGKCKESEWTLTHSSNRTKID